MYTRQQRWLPATERYATIEKTLQKCSQTTFPNIRNLLQMFAILPVTVASCERPFSNLKRIVTLFRSIMTEGRLVGLTLMNIHSEFLKNLDVGIILKEYFLKYGHRKDSS